MDLPVTSVTISHSELQCRNWPRTPLLALQKYLNVEKADRRLSVLLRLSYIFEILTEVTGDRAASSGRDHKLA